MRFSSAVLIPFTAILSLAMQTGCVSSAPPGNAAFASVEKLEAFCGTYENLGEAERRGNRYFLSSLLFNERSSVENEAVKRIEIAKAAENELEARALGSDGQERRRKRFVLNKDFTFEDGKIVVLSEWQSTVPFKLVGAGHFHIYIGIDQNGDGKCESGGTAAGLFACLFPIAMNATREIRFKRLDAPEKP